MADKTTLAESAQALFCAAADYTILKGKKMDDLFDTESFPVYESFEYMWNNSFPNFNLSDVFAKHIETPKITFKELQKFLNDNKDWYTSSVLIAKKLIEDIDKVVKGFTAIKRPKATEIWFVRGDKPVMDNIAILFKLANKTMTEMNRVDDVDRVLPFGDINKWSPADIYFASDKARSQIENEVRTYKGKKGYLFSQLNMLVSDLIDSNDLLPLSLKKQTRQVTLVPVNFNRKYELEAFKKLKFMKTTDWKPYKVDSPQTRDMSVYFNPESPKETFKFKHDVSTGTFKIDYMTGGSARGGGIGSISIFAELMSFVDPTFARKLEDTFNKGNEKFRAKMKAFGPKVEKSASKEKREAYEKYRIEASALNVINEVMPLLKKWFNGSSQEKSDRVVRLMYEYVSSRSRDSGKFVIAK